MCNCVVIVCMLVPVNFCDVCTLNMCLCLQVYVPFVRAVGFERKGILLGSR